MYNTKKLVYYEKYEDIREAIQREKQLKKWKRNRKIVLIEKENPEQKDKHKLLQFMERYPQTPEKQYFKRNNPAWEC